VLDPPYPNGNVRYSDATVDYEALVDLLLRARFRWVLCGYPHSVLCRLGKPFWARDVNLLCIRGSQEPRTECLWRNSDNHQTLARRYLLPEAAKIALSSFDNAASLSFPALDLRIDRGLGLVAKDWNALLPYLLEMNRRLSAPGKRTDLRKGAPLVCRGRNGWNPSAINWDVPYARSSACSWAKLNHLEIAKCCWRNIAPVVVRSLS
jgi:hypothetical protein